MSYVIFHQSYILHLLSFLLFMFIIPLERIELRSVGQVDGTERNDEVKVERLLEADEAFRGFSVLV